MKGLPRATGTTRRRPVWSAVILGGIERLTDQLYRGEEFSADDLRDMQELERRLDAFKAALDMRVKAAQEVIDND